MSDKSVTKSVQMVGYDEEEHSGELKPFITKVSGIDVTETETVTEEKVEVVVDAGGGEKRFQISEWDFTENGLKQAKAETGGDRVRIEREVEEKEQQVNSDWQAANELREELLEAMPDKFSAGGEQFQQVRSKRWESDDSQVSVRRPNFDERRILSKEENREDDDLYETLSEAPSAKMVIQIDSNSHDVIDAVSEGFIPRLHKALANVDGVGKVRYMACERQTVEEGECYNI